MASDRRTVWLKTHPSKLIAPKPISQPSNESVYLFCARVPSGRLPSCGEWRYRSTKITISRLFQFTLVYRMNATSEWFIYVRSVNIIFIIYESDWKLEVYRVQCVLVSAKCHWPFAICNCAIAVNIYEIKKKENEKKTSGPKENKVRARVWERERETESKWIAE